MINHLSFKVADYSRSKEFYTIVLSTLGYELKQDYPDRKIAGIRKGSRGDIWIVEGNPSAPIHIAFDCDTRRKVDEFYTVARENGGRCNGEPGIRKHDHPRYYAAYVFDFDGNNIEAVCEK